jgi:adenylate cyclase
MRDTIVHFRGRVVDSPGDNLLAEFTSAVDAVQAAMDIQRRLHDRNAELPEGRRLEFRIGVSLGDVLVEAGSIYGDSVNVAARIQALAEGGGLCVSGAVHDQLAGRVAVSWDFLGEPALKNIAHRVPVYRARLPSAGAAPRADLPAVPTDRPSIAVLPFRDLDPGEGSPYFGDGIVEDVIGALASLPDLFVISRNSTSRFREHPVDLKTVARELSVRYVLSGSIRRARERIRIAAELADAESQTVVWTERIDGRADDLFALQDVLAERTVTAIAPQVQEAEIRRARRKRPDSLDAYDFMLRGLDLLYRLRRSEFDQAREMFDRSIDLDPGYAAPYALSAIWHSIRLNQAWSDDRAADYAAVTRRAEAALQLDPRDPRALALCGHVRAFLAHDYEGAFALFDRATAASPNSAVAWYRAAPPTATSGTPWRRRGAPSSGFACRRTIRTCSTFTPRSAWPATRPGNSARRSHGAARPCARIRATRPTSASWPPAWPPLAAGRRRGRWRPPCSSWSRDSAWGPSARPTPTGTRPGGPPWPGTWRRPGCRSELSETDAPGGATGYDPPIRRGGATMSGLGASNMNMNMNMNMGFGNVSPSGTITRVRFNTADYRKLVVAPPAAPAVMPTYPPRWDADLQAYWYLKEFVETNPGWFATLDAKTGTLPTDPAIVDAQILAVLNEAPDREDRFLEIIDQHDAEGAIGYYLGMLMIDPARHPNTYLLIRAARRVGELVVMCLKQKYRCPRPSQLCAAIVPMIDPPATPAFPAGHALQGRLISRCLKEARPNAQPGLLDYLGQRIGWNRVIAGLHFPRDGEAGVDVADECFRLLKNGVDFKALLAAAAGEA